MKLNILIAGVGGQGALTTAAVIARAAMKSGLNVITAETHGMAQRGGSVEVHVRIGDVKAPLIPEGGADILIALEPSEALRYSKYISENTVVILNTRKIIPPSVTTGQSKYPDLKDIVSEIQNLTKNIKVVNASELAEKIGTILATNIVVIGMLLAYCDIPIKYEDVEKTIQETMPEKVVDLNLKALKIGYEYAKSGQHAEV